MKLIKRNLSFALLLLLFVCLLSLSASAETGEEAFTVFNLNSYLHPGPTVIPATGDSASLLQWTVLASLSLASISLLILLRKSRKQTNRN